jgi:hypothetical protein
LNSRRQFPSILADEQWQTFFNMKFLTNLKRFEFYDWNFSDMNFFFALGFLLQFSFYGIYLNSEVIFA